VRKNEDSLKQKADGDEIDSLSALMNDLYERMMEMQRNGGVPLDENAPRPSLSLPFPTRNLGAKDN